MTKRELQDRLRIAQDLQKANADMGLHKRAIGFNRIIKETERRLEQFQIESHGTGVSQ